MRWGPISRVCSARRFPAASCLRCSASSDEPLPATPESGRRARAALGLKTPSRATPAGGRNSGSEMTDAVGETDGRIKTIQRAPQLLPRTVVYDVELILGLPPAIAAVSGLNASYGAWLCGLQGNRISKQGQQLGQVAIIPTGAHEFSAQRPFGSFLLNDVQRHMSQDRKIVRTVTYACPNLVFVHDDIQTPVQPVLHPPMRAHDFIEAVRR